MSKWLITGGAGCVGSHIIRKLEKRKIKAIVLDNLSAYPMDYWKVFGCNKLKNVEFVDGDILDKKLVNKLVAQCDVVVHAAAYADVGASIRNPQIDFKNNVIGTEILLEACLKNKEKIKKFTFISSASVYGEPKWNNGKPPKFTEDQKLNPINTYGCSKMWGEQQTKLFNDLYGMPTTSIRFGSVYGENQTPKKGSHSWMVAIWTQQLMKGKKITIFGDGSQVRDMTYVEDIAEGVIRATLSNKTNGKMINLGTDKPTNLLQIASMLKKHFGNFEVEFAPKKAGDSLGGYCDIKLMQSLLGWKPKIKLEDGIKKYVKWIRKNPEALQKWL